MTDHKIMPEILQGSHVNALVWTPLTGVESGALAQLRNVASLPIMFHHVAAMPDVHFGAGATVGSVIAMKEALIPAAVGVDIACGMGAILTNLHVDDLKGVDKSVLRNSIERTIPVGFNSHKESMWKKYNYADEIEQLLDTIPHCVSNKKDNASIQLGTLGSGNHFIELDQDEQGRIWLMLHSGSRNTGLRIAEYHIKIAKNLKLSKDLPDANLAYFLAGSPEFESYLEDVLWAQQYAHWNRRLMADLVMKSLKHYLSIKIEDEVWCHHNFVERETHFGESVYVTRKGAIKAGTGERGIIPGSMGSSSYIVEGKGNPDSFNSASHGAGRRMSRSKAKESFTLTDLDQQMVGIEYRRDSSILDEIPGAYKDIDEVMANQVDLVDVKEKLHQILVVKG